MRGTAARWDLEWGEVGGKCSQSFSRSFGRAERVHTHQGLSRNKRVQIIVLLRLEETLGSFCSDLVLKAGSAMSQTRLLGAI